MFILEVKKFFRFGPFHKSNFELLYEFKLQFPVQFRMSSLG